MTIILTSRARQSKLTLVLDFQHTYISDPFISLSWEKYVYTIDTKGNKTCLFKRDVSLNCPCYDLVWSEPGETLSMAGLQSVLRPLLTNPSHDLRVTRLSEYGEGNDIHQLPKNSYKPFISNIKSPSFHPNSTIRPKLIIHTSIPTVKLQPISPHHHQPCVPNPSSSPPFPSSPPLLPPASTASPSQAPSPRVPTSASPS